MGGAIFSYDGSKFYINHNTTIYRGSYDSGTDSYAYDSWSTTVTTAPTHIDINPAGTLLAVGSGNNLVVIRVDTQAVVLTYAMGATVYCCEFSPDGQYLIAGAYGAVPRIFKVVDLTVTYLASFKVNEGNWSCSWHPDSDHFAFSQHNLGSTRGAHIYKKTGVDTFTKLTSPFSDGGLAVSATGCGYAADGTFYIAAALADDFRAYRRSGDSYIRETLTGGPSGATISIRGARSSNVIALHKDGSIPYVSAYSFPAAANYVNGSAIYPVFTASGSIDVPVGVNGSQSYPVFGTSGNVDVPVALNSDITYPVFIVAGAAGAFPKSFTSYSNAPVAYLSSVAKTTFSIETPTETFLHGGYSYPGYVSSGEINVVTQTTGDLIYPSYQVNGIIGAIETTVNVVYPLYEIDAELYNIREVEADLFYPFFTVDSDVKLTDEVNSDIVYPLYSVDYKISATSIRADVVYPVYEASADVYDNYVDNSEAIYPVFGVSGEIERVNSATADLYYSVFGISGEAEVYPYVDTEITYPVYRVEGNVNAPIGTSGDIYYPSFYTNGVVGIKVSVNGNPTFPVYDIEGTIGFVMSLDATVRYPKYRIAGVTGEPVDIDTNINYPIFGVNFQIENYYTMESNINVNIGDIATTIDRVGPRKNLFIIDS